MLHKNEIGKIILTRALHPHTLVTRIILMCAQRTVHTLLSCLFSQVHWRRFDLTTALAAYTLSVCLDTCRGKSQRKSNSSFSSMCYLSRGSLTNESHYSCLSHSIIAWHCWLIFLLKHMLLSWHYNKLTGEDSTRVKYLEFFPSELLSANHTQYLYKKASKQTRNKS